MDFSNSDHIPIVDFSIINQPDGESKLGENVAHVLRTSGFMYVKNHGVPQETIDAVFNASDRVFNLPLEKKSKHPRSSKFEPSCGYVPMGAEKLDGVKREEIRESYNFIPYDKKRLPEDVPEFGPACEKLFWSSWEFSKKLLESLAVGLGLENKEVFAEDSHRFLGRPGNFTTLRIQHYPACVNNREDVSVKKDLDVKPENKTRCGAHTDYGTLTVLYQDDVGGLEVETSPGVFVPCVPIPGTVVINIGDIMQRWTSDRLRSTVHAVTLGKENRIKARQSIAFFLHPDDEYVVRCLDADDLHAKEKYPPISGKEYLRERMYASFTKYFGQDE